MKNKLKIFNNFLYILLSILIPYVSIIGLIASEQFSKVNPIFHIVIEKGLNCWVFIGLFTLILNLYEHFTDNKIFMDKKYNILIGIFNVSIMLKIIYNLLLIKATLISFAGISTDVILSLLILVYNILAKDYHKEKIKDKIIRLFKIFNNMVILSLLLLGLIILSENLSFGIIVRILVFAFLATLIISTILGFKEVTLSKKHNKKVLLINILSIISVILCTVLSDVDKIPKLLIIVMFVFLAIFVISVLVLFIIDLKEYIKTFIKNKSKKSKIFFLISVYLIFVFIEVLFYVCSMQFIMY